MRTVLKSSLVAVLVLCCGCAFFKPVTKVKINPVNKTIDVENSKDVDVTMKNYKDSKTSDGGSSTAIGEITISDKASPVVYANVQQMLAFVEQQRAANEGIRIALTGISQTIKELIPFLNLTPNTLAAVLNQLKEVDVQIDLANKKIITGSPATQPAAVLKEE